MSDAIHSRMAIVNATSAHSVVTTSNSNSSGNSKVVDAEALGSAATANATAAVTLEIESRDVIRSILQFLKEQNLTEAMKALQSESGAADRVWLCVTVGSILTSLYVVTFISQLIVFVFYRNHTEHYRQPRVFQVGHFEWQMGPGVEADLFAQSAHREADYPL